MGSNTGRVQPFDAVVIRFTRQIFYEERAIYQAEVRESPPLLRGGPFRADIEEQLQRFRMLFAQRIAAEHGYGESLADVDPEIELGTRDLAALGERLYLLLPDALRAGLPHVLQRAFDKQRGVRLIFEARAGDAADQLLSLPWEILYVPELKQYLGLLPTVTIVRRLLETVRRVGPQIDPPFRIAHVIADTATPYPIDPELQATERAAIRRAATQEDHYTLVENPGSVDRLLDQLRQRPYEIVHFLGHGDVDMQFSRQSYLLFADEGNTPQIVSCEQFSHLLSVSPGTQIIVLNACHGASIEGANTVAMQLVYNGIPYVVAMQGEVFQKAAGVFAQTFYAGLQSHASLDEAVAQSRREVAAQLPGTIDWSLPALYVSAGTAAATPTERVVNSIETLLSQREGQLQISRFIIGLGVAHLLVASLLLFSSVRLPPPEAGAVLPVIAALVPLPPLLALGARLFGRLPSSTTPGVQGLLLLRIFGATALGLALPAVYAWFTLWLLVGMGFWAILAPLARTALLVLLFAPSLAVSWQQALGHAHGFFSNAQMAVPTFDWQELILIAAGYLILCGPLALLWLAPQLVAPPLGNVVAGLFLMALGYQFRKVAGAA